MGEKMKMGSGTPSVGRQVVFYSPSTQKGAPAIVTGVNTSGTLSLFVMMPGDTFHRFDVQEYVEEPGDELEDRFGFWAWPERV